MLLRVDREAQDLAGDLTERALLRLVATLWDIAKTHASNIPPRGAADPLTMEAANDGSDTVRRAALAEFRTGTGTAGG